MANQSKWLVLAAMFPIVMLSTTASAKPVEAVTAITYIDAIPDQFVAGNEEKAQALLRKMNTDTAQEPGLISFTILQEPARPNHFTLLEVWKNEKAFDAHELAPHTRAFRNDLQPLIGSPYDTLVTKKIE
jgi:quinol monooxygenase YgiN